MVASLISVVVIIVTVILPVIAVIVYCAGTRHRRGQSNIYDAPYTNHHLPPLPSRTQRMAIYNSSRDDQQNQPLGNIQSESKSLDNKFESEGITANRSLNNNSQLSDKSGKATNETVVLSQSPSTNPDTTEDSSTFSIRPDSPSDSLLLNLAIDDRAENPNDELGIIPSPHVTEIASSTRFSLEMNPAIAPEVETRANIAYEHMVSVCPSLTTTLDAAVSAMLPASPMHSIETDLPFERTDDGTGSDLPPSNAEVGDTTEDYTGSTENSNNASRVPSPMRIGVNTGPIYANATI